MLCSMRLPCGDKRSPRSPNSPPPQSHLYSSCSQKQVSSSQLEHIHVIRWRSVRFKCHCEVMRLLQCGLFCGEV
ncbi:hypothetical protein M378DRAFT_271185 [Amanita muscaria Koide BX008]|uniref:Uncharacterized protein n=1 Tax=Amanita muscaria (strain Koide BX008) TaxID=946122 RepID=A0A0C2XDX8_AMAMK|nr:hypothetical protein M378DRAFT_271185 [Amanita muscaria Koide BX008]